MTYLLPKVRLFDKLPKICQSLAKKGLVNTCQKQHEWDFTQRKQLVRNYHKVKLDATTSIGLQIISSLFYADKSPIN